MNGFSESQALQAARQAWEIAEMPLFDGGIDETVMVAPDAPPDRQVLSASLFIPTAQEIDSDISGEHLWDRIMPEWDNNLRATYVLRRYHGGEGERIIPDIAREYGVVAKEIHRASAIATAVRILVGETIEKPETILSIWDNGRQYWSCERMVERFCRDEMWDLRSGRAVWLGWHEIEAQPALIVCRTVERLKGMFTVISGQRRMTVELDSNNEYEFRCDVVDEPVLGNVMVARLPHLETA